jgi:integrase
MRGGRSMKPRVEYLKGRYRGVYRVTGKKGVTYGIDLTDSKGRRVRRVVGKDLQAALRELQAVKGRKAEGRSIGLYTASNRITFGELAKNVYEPEILQAVENRGSLASMLTDLRTLLAFFALTPLNKITTAEVERYTTLRRRNQITIPDYRFRTRVLEDGREFWRTTAHSKKPQISFHTIRRELRTLRSILRHAVKRGLLSREALPETPRVKSDRREPYVTKEQLHKILAAADPRIKPIIGLALATGRRRMELLSLTPSQVDWQAKVIIFRRLKSHRKAIFVPMNRTVQAILEDLPRPLADDALYFSIPHRDLQRLWDRAVRAAGITDLHLHDLRHVVASHLLNKGVPDQMRAEVLGHSAGGRFAMTARYSHATIEYLRRVYEELDDLAPELWQKLRPEAQYSPLGH